MRRKERSVIWLCPLSERDFFSIRIDNFKVIFDRFESNFSRRAQEIFLMKVAVSWVWERSFEQAKKTFWSTERSFPMGKKLLITGMELTLWRSRMWKRETTETDVNIQLIDHRPYNRVVYLIVTIIEGVPLAQTKNSWECVYAISFFFNNNT